MKEVRLIDAEELVEHMENRGMRKLASFVRQWAEKNTLSIKVLGDVEITRGRKANT